MPLLWVWADSTGNNCRWETATERKIQGDSLNCQIMRRSPNNDQATTDLTQERITSPPDRAGVYICQRHMILFSVKSGAMSVTFSKLIPQSPASTLTEVGAGECGAVYPSLSSQFTYNLKYEYLMARY